MVSVHMHTCVELNINHHSSSAHHVKDLPCPDGRTRSYAGACEEKPWLS